MLKKMVLKASYEVHIFKTIVSGISLPPELLITLGNMAVPKIIRVQIIKPS